MRDSDGLPDFIHRPDDKRRLDESPAYEREMRRPRSDRPSVVVIPVLSAAFAKTTPLACSVAHPCNTVPIVVSPSEQTFL